MDIHYPPIFEEILSQVFAHQSLEESIQLLALCLKKHIPFTKMTCYASDIPKKRHYPLIVLNDDGVLENATPRFLNNPPEEWVQGHILDHDHAIYIDHDCEHSGVGFRNVFDDRRSMLAMTLYQSEQYIINIVLASPLPHQFTHAHAGLLKILHKPLAHLAHTFFKSQPDTPLYLTTEGTAKLSSLELLKRCKGLRQSVRLLEGVAATDSIVLLQGETGVGKELFAEALHMLSNRKGNPFVRVNCAAITPSLLDDAFFGHEKGAFTGAANTHQGFFEQATTGTLFLDEIGELSPEAQARLLRVLETQEIVRVGGQRRILINVRLVAASHRNLEAMVSHGTFREDLWYRISVFPILIPPLRQRKEDIPTLTRWFHSTAAKQISHGPVPAITEEFISSLLPQAWPGNVRQLRHHIEQSLIRANIVHSAVMRPLPQLAGTAPGPEDAPPSQDYPPPEEDSLDAFNAQHIQRALEKCKGRLQGPFGAAVLLNINASTLRSRMRKLGIHRSC